MSVSKPDCCGGLSASQEVDCSEFGLTMGVVCQRDRKSSRLSALHTDVKRAKTRLPQSSLLHADDALAGGAENIRVAQHIAAARVGPGVRVIRRVR